MITINDIDIPSSHIQSFTQEIVNQVVEKMTREDQSGETSQDIKAP